MTALLQALWRDEAAFILSAEMVIILTVAVLGMIVGLSTIQQALTAEFVDLGRAFQSLNQSYGTPSFYGCMKWSGWGGRTSWVAGSAFIDIYDGCVGGTGVGNSGCEIQSNSNFVGTTGCSTGGDACVPQSTTGSSTPNLMPTPDPAQK